MTEEQPMRKPDGSATSAPPLMNPSDRSIRQGFYRELEQAAERRGWALRARRRAILMSIPLTLAIGLGLWALLLGFFAAVRFYGLPDAVSQVGMFVFGMVAVAVVQAIRDYLGSFEDDEPARERKPAIR